MRKRHDLRAASNTATRTGGQSRCLRQVLGGEVVVSEEDILVIHEGGVVEERGRFDGPSVTPRSRVGHGEDCVVFAR